MTHGRRTLREFYTNEEPIEDFYQIFKFYFLANDIKDGIEAQRNHTKALFITLVGQAMFAKLTDLLSPCVIVDLLLVDNMVLKTHY